MGFSPKASNAISALAGTPENSPTIHGLLARFYVLTPLPQAEPKPRHSIVAGKNGSVNGKFIRSPKLPRRYPARWAPAVGGLRPSAHQGRGDPLARDRRRRVFAPRLHRGVCGDLLIRALLHLSVVARLLGGPGDSTLARVPAVAA
jgi:hypothetical protein